MNKKILSLLILSFAICTVVFGASKFAAKYIKTSDGDTARFSINGENRRVRFLGINTPEVSGENKLEQPYGNEALAFASEKLENAKKIELEYDEHADKEDKYGRPLVWVWVDGALYQEEILKVGLAKTYMLENNYKYADRLKKAENEAKEGKLGIWSDGTSHIFNPSSAMINNDTENIPNNEDEYESYIDNEEIEPIETHEEYPIENEVINDYEKHLGVRFWIILVVVIAYSIYIQLKRNKTK